MGKIIKNLSISKEKQKWKIKENYKYCDNIDLDQTDKWNIKVQSGK